VTGKQGLTTAWNSCPNYKGRNTVKIIQYFFSVEVNRTAHRLLWMNKITLKTDLKKTKFIKPKHHLYHQQQSTSHSRLVQTS
jgi:hypothetical protein